MNWSDLDFAPPARKLRQFAGLWLAFFSTLAAWHGLYHGRATDRQRATRDCVAAEISS